VPHTPDFLCSFVGSLNFMRPSLKKGAHAVLSRAAYRKFGVSRSFFARCGIPRLFAPDFSQQQLFPQPVQPWRSDFGSNINLDQARGYKSLRENSV
jgi:hypothetical protein